MKCSDRVSLFVSERSITNILDGDVGGIGIGMR